MTGLKRSINSSFENVEGCFANMIYIRVSLNLFYYSGI